MSQRSNRLHVQLSDETGYIVEQVEIRCSSCNGPIEWNADFLYCDDCNCARPFIDLAEYIADLMECPAELQLQLEVLPAEQPWKLELVFNDTPVTSMSLTCIECGSSLHVQRSLFCFKCRREYDCFSLEELAEELGTF